MSLKLNKLMRLVEEFRKLDPEMPAQTILAFLFIAERNQAEVPVTVKDVGDYLGLSSASASRNVSALSKVSRHRTSGHDLIMAYENPERRIEKFIKLTPKGKRVIDSIEELLK
jgi:DNA-binding MarR family transcriptional regulator